MAWPRFRNQSRMAISRAQKKAGELQLSEIDTILLLWGILTQAEVEASPLLKEMKVDVKPLRLRIESQFTPVAMGNPTTVKLTPQSKRLLKLASAEAHRINSKDIATEHLLLGYLRLEEEAKPGNLRWRFILLSRRGDSSGLRSGLLGSIGLTLKETRAVVERMDKGSKTGLIPKF